MAVRALVTIGAMATSGEGEEEADTNESGEMKESIWVIGNACMHITQCT